MKEKPNTPKSIPEETLKVKTPQIPAKPAEEIGGRGGLDPVRYGDWEIGGKCVDF